jgi:hypothetical protein
MSLHSKWHSALVAVLFVLAATIAWQGAMAQDLVHEISGVVKKMDKVLPGVVCATKIDLGSHCWFACGSGDRWKSLAGGELG